MSPWYIDLLQQDIINSICLSIFVSNWVKKFSSLENILENVAGNTSNILIQSNFTTCIAIRLYLQYIFMVLCYI